MDTFMLVITAFSVVVAAAASAIAWRATQAERHRSAARVAALSAAAGVEVATAPRNAPDTGTVETPDGLHEFMPARPAVAEPGTGAAPATPMFGPAVADSGSGGRQHGLLAAAAIVFVLIGGGSLVLLVSGRTPSATTRAARVPLELVSLTHARPDGELIVTGLVRNPGGGTIVEQLEVHVRVFDAAGILIATRSAPVDVAMLAAGDDSPFAVTLGAATTAARYRVSFASSGAMLAHVDRRTNLPAAVTADAR